MQHNPLTAIDFYKADHRRQYPEGTTEVYSNFTPRSSHHAQMLDDFDDRVVFFGLQAFVRDFLVDTWNRNFFDRDLTEVVDEYERRMVFALGPNDIGVQHVADLHQLGYLPIEIKALPEGSRVPIGVPVMTMRNTHPKFFWLTNYLESVASCYLWKPITSATTAFEYKRLLSKFASSTGADPMGVMFQAHDFSMRGMSGLFDASLSGMAHLTSFWGTDSVSAIDAAEIFYDADAATETIGASVPATEHSVMCMGTKEGELETFRRLVCDLYPSGILSVVSDTWDFWKVITELVPSLKEEILARDGKVVVRPDSGDPVKIICGDPDAPEGSPEHKGAVECLWETFGGRENAKGFKELDDHIGLIYGDSITLERARLILEKLMRKGFASDSVVFGVGSFTYQHVTRDTFGFAMKATSGVVNGERRDIFKDPKTGSSKRSAKGLLRVEEVDGTFKLIDEVSVEEERGGALETVFVDGLEVRTQTFSDVRQRIADQL